MAGPCGGCDACCHLLAVDDIGKPQDTRCSQSQPGRPSGCCSIYDERPGACAAFRCLWLASQSRGPTERLDVWLRPDKTHVVFYRSGLENDPRTIFAHADPAFPQAWQVDPVQSEIVRLMKNGATVVVVVADQRIVLRDGQPLMYATAAELARMRDRRPLRAHLLGSTAT